MNTTNMAVLAIALNPQSLQDYAQTLLLWVQAQGAVGVLVFIALYALATVLLIPGSLLTLGGGVIFGLLFGSIYVFTGAALGATLAFLVGRYLLRNWVANRIEGRDNVKAIDAAIAHEGLKIVILTRLSPVFPFTLLNYVLSITQVSLKDYMLGFVGMIPGTVMYVYLGSLAGNLAAINKSVINPQAETVQWVIRILGFVATLAVTLYVTRIARQALDTRVNGVADTAPDRPFQ
jgi:uncharacterized membrane protein YdjX (TVP38/TMEM64 family)